MSLWPSDSNSTGMRLVRGRSIPASLFGYEVVDVIGHGARSTIYVVSHPETKQLYALKHVIRENDKDTRFIEQLETEYNVSKAVNHPSLRRIIDCKINRNLLRKVSDAALVMELFDGQSLESKLPDSLGEIVRCFLEAGYALQAMHNAGYVHCDFKPNNVLRNSSGAIKVIDLGQACAIGTVKKRIQGTPDYIAPEQVKCKAMSKQTDVYNFGASLYWAVTGQKMPTAFTVKRSDTSLFVDEAIPAPHQLNPAVPEQLSTFIMECVRTSLSKRPADMTAVVNRLDVLHYLVQRAEGSLPPMEGDDRSAETRFAMT